MKNLTYAYRKALAEIAMGMDDLMADLEDIRDEAQELMEDGGQANVKNDVEKMDEALRLLDLAAAALDGEE